MITIVSLCLISVGLLFLLISSNVILLLGGIALVAIGQKAFTPPMQSILLDAVSKENNAGDYGAVRTVFFAIGSAGPLYMGIMASLLGYDFAFLGLVACMIFGSALLFKLGTKYNHNSVNKLP